MRERGLVLSIEKNKVTCITRDGRLVSFRVASDGIMVGTEVLIPSGKTPGTALAFRLAVAAALAVAFLVGSFIWYPRYLYARPSLAYVTLDGEGSIELLVNDKLRVVSAQAFNEEGERALAAVKYELKPVQQVIRKLSDLLSSDDFSSAGIIFSIIPVSAETESKMPSQMDSLEKSVKAEAKRFAEQRKLDPASVEPLKLDPELREAAAKLGMSAGRAAAWAAWVKKHGEAPGQDTKKNVPPAEEIKDFKNMNPSEAKKAVEELGEKIKSGPSQGHEQGKPQDQPSGKQEQGSSGLGKPENTGNETGKGSSDKGSGRNAGGGQQGKGQRGR